MQIAYTINGAIKFTKLNVENAMGFEVAEAIARAEKGEVKDVYMTIGRNTRIECILLIDQDRWHVVFAEVPKP